MPMTINLNAKKNADMRATPDKAAACGGSNGSHGNANLVQIAFMIAATAVMGGMATGQSLGQLPIAVFLVPLFFGISFFYSSVGFGGGSSYIAILAISGISLYAVPSYALALNIIAASMAFANFVRAGHFSAKFALPFLSSVPFAFIGGLVVLPQQSLAWVFAAALFAASAALFLTSKKKIAARISRMASKDEDQVTAMSSLSSSSRDAKRDPLDKNKAKRENLRRLLLIGFPIGAVLGTIAGMVGIGGGIWLSPILILAGLAGPKRAAATASLFILANSASGIAAHSMTKTVDVSLLVPLAATVFAGGFIGSRFGAFKFDHNKIRLIVACLVSLAGLIIVLKATL